MTTPKEEQSHQDKKSSNTPAFLPGLTLQTETTHHPGLRIRSKTANGSLKSTLQHLDLADQKQLDPNRHGRTQNQQARQGPQDTKQ
jgi:hypothetical protein